MVVDTVGFVARRKKELLEPEVSVVVLASLLISWRITMATRNKNKTNRRGREVFKAEKQKENRVF